MHIYNIGLTSYYEAAIYVSASSELLMLHACALD